MSGESLTPEGLDAAIALAQGQGFDVVRADDRTLLLDIDTPEALTQYERVLPVIAEHYGVSTVEHWKSKSGRDHFRLTLALPQEPLMRYAMQSALGSDGVREALILCQYRNGCEEPSILFRPKVEEIAF